MARTLPSRDELVECAERLGDRRDPVGTVVLVEVDVVGAEPAERALRPPAGCSRASRGRHRCRRGPGPSRTWSPITTLLATAGEEAAEEVLARAVAVALGRVEERDAGLERGLDDRAARAGSSMRQPKVLQPRPTADTVDPGGAERTHVHSET